MDPFPPTQISVTMSSRKCLDQEIGAEVYNVFNTDSWITLDCPHWALIIFIENEFVFLLYPHFKEDGTYCFSSVCPSTRSTKFCHFFLR